MNTEKKNNHEKKPWETDLYSHLFKKEFVDVPTVKDRIFNRFMFQHSMNANILGSDYPEFKFTPLEANGIVSKLARFSNDCGFDSAVDHLQATIRILMCMEASPGSPDDKTNIMDYVDTLIYLCNLFAWLDAYGPVSDE